MRDYSNMSAQQFGKGLFGLKKDEVYTFLREAETDFRKLRDEHDSLEDQLESVTKASQENQLRAFNLQKEVDELKAAVKAAEERADAAEAEVAKAQAAVIAAKAAAQAATAAAKPKPQPAPKPQAPKAAPKPQPQPAPRPKPQPQPAPKPKPMPEPVMEDEEDDDSVFSGEVEDTKKKVSSAFRISNDDDEDAGFDFL